MQFPLPTAVSSEHVAVIKWRKALRLIIYYEIVQECKTHLHTTEKLQENKTTCY